MTCADVNRDGLRCTLDVGHGGRHAHHVTGHNPVRWSDVREPWNCVECGSPDLTALGPSDHRRAWGPGEWTVYECRDCGLACERLMPEPPDGYAGDGVFAEDH